MLGATPISNRRAMSGDVTHKRQFKKTIIEKPSLRGDRKIDEAIQKSD